MMTSKSMKLAAVMAALLAGNVVVAAGEAKADAKAATPAAAPAATTETKAAKPGFFSSSWSSVKNTAGDFKDFAFGGSKKAVVVKVAGIAALTYVAAKAAKAAYDYVAGEQDNA